jgi:hypothetical protein
MILRGSEAVKHTSERPFWPGCTVARHLEVLVTGCVEADRHRQRGVMEGKGIFGTL